jgi:hypothetical protein
VAGELIDGIKGIGERLSKMLNDRGAAKNRPGPDCEGLMVHRTGICTSN